MTGGRIMHHLFNRLPNEQDTVIVVGYQAEGTRGRRIVDGETAIKIMGQMVSVKARVEQIDGLSAHADQTELLFWLKHFQDKPKFTFLVHGEPHGLLAFQSVIKTELGWDAIIPAYLESFVLFKGI
jgi:metallo-beta-lactamase family protein